MSKWCILLLVSSTILLGVSIYYQMKTNGWLNKEHFDASFAKAYKSDQGSSDVTYYPKIVTSSATEPSEDEITAKFNKCIADGNDTVKGCLTSSGAGFRPVVCRKLCVSQYGELSRYCTSVCSEQQNQVNTSARFGPA